jgi:hypothetical protein
MHNEQRTEANDLEAMRVLGKPFAECSSYEQEAVEFSVAGHRMIGAMNAREARTVGDLFAARDAQATTTP